MVAGRKGFSSSFRGQARQVLGLVGKEKLSKGQKDALRKKMRVLANQAEFERFRKMQRENLGSVSNPVAKTPKKEVWARESVGKINPQKAKEERKIREALLKVKIEERVRNLLKLSDLELQNKVKNLYFDLLSLKAKTQDPQILTRLGEAKTLYYSFNNFVPLQTKQRIALLVASWEIKKS